MEHNPFHGLKPPTSDFLVVGDAPFNHGTASLNQRHGQRHQPNRRRRLSASSFASPKDASIGSLWDETSGEIMLKSGDSWCLTDLKWINMINYA